MMIGPTEIFTIFFVLARADHRRRCGRLYKGVLEFRAEPEIVGRRRDG